MYLRTIPGQSNQVGFYTLLNTNQYWGQVGYNNFYGFALGAGYTFFKRISVGALAEFGTGASLVKESSFELMASYFLGTPDERHQMVGHDIEGDAQNALDKIEEEQEGEKETELRKAEREKDKEREALAKDEKREEVRKRDSLDKAKRAETLKAEQQRKIDSVAQARAATIRAAKKAEESEAQKEADAQPETGEKYEEVTTEAGMLPGYYLIANVFGTQKYFDEFMADLGKKGMQPKSFRRSTNGYNYVYLQRYKTIQQAREARDNQYGGRYTGKTWIFRVVGK
jgi:hypothetical protein